MVTRGLKKLSTVGPRFESSPFGQAAISGVIVLMLFIGVVWSLPDAEVERRLAPVLQPIAWRPGWNRAGGCMRRIRRAAEFLDVRVALANGAQRVWTNPRGDRVVGAFAWYHWQKVKENAVHDPASRAGVAHWIVRRLTGRSERAVRVQMILRTESLPAPGTNGSPVPGEEILYDETLTGEP